jgi:hypothetical protein
MAAPYLVKPGTFTSVFYYSVSPVLIDLGTTSALAVAEMCFTYVFIVRETYLLFEFLYLPLLFEFIFVPNAANLKLYKTSSLTIKHLRINFNRLASQTVKQHTYVIH